MTDKHWAILWAALAKIADKEGRRELLAGGETHELDLDVRGDLDGRGIERFTVLGKLSIAEDGTRAKTVAVPVEHLVGFLLGQLARARRESLLRALPERFLAAGERIPDVDPVRIEEAKGLLSRLSGRTEQAVRGSVSCKYSIE